MAGWSYKRWNDDLTAGGHDPHLATVCCERSNDNGQQSGCPGGQASRINHHVQQPETYETRTFGRRPGANRDTIHDIVLSREALFPVTKKKLDMIMNSQSYSGVSNWGHPLRDRVDRLPLPPPKPCVVSQSWDLRCPRVRKNAEYTRTLSVKYTHRGAAQSMTVVEKV